MSFSRTVAQKGGLPSGCGELALGRFRCARKERVHDAVCASRLVLSEGPWWACASFSRPDGLENGKTGALLFRLRFRDGAIGQYLRWEGFRVWISVTRQLVNRRQLEVIYKPLIFSPHACRFDQRRPQEIC